MDDAKLRSILRSVIVVATAAPAAVAFSCGVVEAVPDGDPDASQSEGGAAFDAPVLVTDAAGDESSIRDAGPPDVLRYPPNDRCMTYGPLPEDGGYGRDTLYEAGVCNTYCAAPDGFDAATSPTVCWALSDAVFGEILGCAYPNGDPSSCGCAPLTIDPNATPTAHVTGPVPCRGFPDGSVNETKEQCGHFCPPRAGNSGCEPEGCGITSGTLTCSYCMFAIGRRAAGVLRVPPARGTALGAFLADACHREAASVTAFARLREELLMHGAPGDLVARAERAREDEIRHAAIMAALARRFGAKEGPWANAPAFETIPERSLEEIAVENAVEGCVYETWSALANFWQAEHATDRVLRRALSAIAEDELRHASLSWSVQEWLLGLLDEPSRGRVEAAKRAAILALTVPPNELADEILEYAGVPDCASSRRLIAALDDSLWRAAA